MAYVKGSKRKGTGMRRVTHPDHPLDQVEFDDGTVWVIVGDQDTLSPIQASNKAPVYWRSIRTLRLAGGGTVYGCADCDYVAESTNQVRPHRNAHRKPKLINEAVDVATAQLIELIKAAESAATLVAERDEWRRRALAAEKDLATLKKVLNR